MRPRRKRISPARGQEGDLNFLTKPHYGTDASSCNTLLAADHYQRTLRRRGDLNRARTKLASTTGRALKTENQQITPVSAPSDLIDG
jgi:hypothetical protein